MFVTCNHYTRMYASYHDHPAIAIQQDRATQYLSKQYIIRFLSEQEQNFPEEQNSENKSEKKSYHLYLIYKWSYVTFNDL